MPRKPPPPICPVDAVLRLLMGSWTTYILWHLQRDGPMRFGALRRAIPGISSKVLTQRLRLLEDSGIVYRDHVPTIPPEVSYGLTEQGAELGEVLDALEGVALRWLARDGQEPSAPRDDGLLPPERTTLARRSVPARLSARADPA